MGVLARKIVVILSGSGLMVALAATPALASDSFDYPTTDNPTAHLSWSGGPNINSDSGCMGRIDSLELDRDNNGNLEVVSKASTTCPMQMKDITTQVTLYSYPQAVRGKPSCSGHGLLWEMWGRWQCSLATWLSGGFGSSQSVDRGNVPAQYPVTSQQTIPCTSTATPHLFEARADHSITDANGYEASASTTKIAWLNCLNN